jgi:UDP-N-acetylmuramyl pentapeptide phosphotransferase/UDP-N-acetylglucosamine-1-phosphate transferase
LLAAAVSAVAFFLFRDRVLVFLKQKRISVINYSGKEVLTGGGLLLLFPCLFATIPALFVIRHANIIFYMIMVFALTFCGMLDDVLGDSSSKGLAGHAGRFLKGGLSTGWIKALTGGMIGMLLAWSRYRNLFLFLLDTLSFALCVNLVNLLDLRPGRAIKGFLFVLFLVMLVSGFTEVWAVLPVVSALVFYLKGEMKETYMLGDTGANLLGGILGFYQTIRLPLEGKIILTLFLALLHILAEFQSFSKWIDAVPILRKIDMLGRKTGGEGN